LPAPRFRGLIGSTYADSEADVISVPSPPAGAPNVVVVLLDDVGFGQAGTFGGPADTPTLQRLAEDGLRYNRFRITNTYPVSGILAFKSYKLADVTTPQIIQKRPTRVPSWSRLELLVLDLLRRGQGSRRQATS